VALIGPSGCGKSTLLRIAAGLERDYFGEVMLENSPVVQPRRALGIMFQEPRLLPWLTNADNVAFGDRRSKESRQRAMGLLDAGHARCAGRRDRELAPPARSL
jgi:sulfonate transport system ATP-binding protein